MSFIHIDPGPTDEDRPSAAPSRRLPPWFKVKLQTGPDYHDIRQIMDRLKLHTICEEARCPNVWECWNARTARFLILGVLMADLIEKGTDNFSVGGTVLQNITSASHASSGLRYSGANQLVEPEVVGSEGGTVGAVDGSVAWRKQSTMKPRYVVWNASGNPSTGFTGYW